MIKKLLTILFILSMCNGAFAGGSLVKGGKKAVQTFTLGNTHIKLPPKMVQMYHFDLQTRFFDYQINAARYPVLSARNDARMLSGIIGFKADLAAFKKHSQQIAENIDSEVIEGKVDYKKFLPQDIDYLYIGELHKETRIQQEISQIVRDLPKIYPNRTIYLATEMVPAKEVPWDDLSILPYSKKAMLSLLEGAEEYNSSWVIQAALDENIPVVGLEPQIAIMNEALVDGKDFLSQEDFNDYASSLEGMHFRNNYWAGVIKELRRRDPSALVVVYAGIDHVAYHNPSALPTLVGGKSFVVQVLIPKYLRTVNPLFRHFKESDVILKQFFSSDNAKLVNSWVVSQKFNLLLGNDLSIIVHE